MQLRTVMEADQDFEAFLRVWTESTVWPTGDFLESRDQQFMAERRGAAMNIDELNSDGKSVAQWCFAPQGNLVVGDVVLAQRIAYRG